MNNKIFYLIIIFFFFSVVVFSQKKENKFIGVKACSMCHKTEKQGKQFDIWKQAKHASAFNTLLSDKAIEIAKEKGLTSAPSETAECLSCHAPVSIADANLLEKNFDIKDGVQCEICHGAGSNYKSPAIMKDKAKSIAAGLTEYADSVAVETQCKKCHNEKSPTFKSFVFAEYWEKIKHPKP